MSLIAGSRIASYDIVALLGAGAMGEVYCARDPRLGLDVAINCLEKAPAARFKSADDLAFALEGLTTHSEPVAALAGRAARPRRESLAWMTAGVFLLAAAALGVMLYQARQISTSPPETRVQLITPPDAHVTSFALSPDGTKLVFHARGQLWLRPLSSDVAQPLSATEGANQGAFTERSDIANLTENEEAWVRHSETLWRKAHAIATANPGVDPGDVYHALRSLELPPAERLHRGLTRVRRRPHLG